MVLMVKREWLLTQGHKKMVLDGVISYFVQQDEKHAADSGVEQRFVRCYTFWNVNTIEVLEWIP